jgi:hypothetical protein
VILSVILTRRQHTDGLESIYKFVGDCGIYSNYFSTLCEMPTDGNPSAKLSVIVAFAVIIFQLSVKC